MKVALVDFWEGFDVDRNFFTIAGGLLGHDFVRDPAEADAIIYSLFGQEHKDPKYDSKKRIAFLTEPYNAPEFTFYDPLVKADYVLGFDHIENERQARLPLWYLYIDWFDIATYGNPQYLVPVKDLVTPNRYSQVEKKRRCAIVYSKPVPSREQLMTHVRRIMPCDHYGREGVPLSAGEQNKLAMLALYQYSIAAENTIQYGYVTEKVLHAKVAGTVPIYFGYSLDPLMNPDCVIHIRPQSKNDPLWELVEKLRLIADNAPRFNHLINQPLFKQLPTVDPAIDALERALS